ncbi:helix-turn-helix domain-containing protein [Streptomyces sp. NPDC020490]|uniref:helix-turn-helix domain-containing protein n=1 Tax=Streptomyces sp. NPDC020490 TaxID=3365078 RepID=UPI0037980D07
MSIEAMAWAFRQNIAKPGAKLVLLALCDFADESWSCFPGQATLAEKTSQGERTVRRHLEWLEQEGFIVSHARFSDGRRTSNRYTIHVPRAQRPPSASPTSSTTGSGTSAQKPRRADGERGGRKTKQAARMATGQSGHRPDQAEEPADLAGEPSDNHQGYAPLPPGDGDVRGDAVGDCPAHPDAPAANCRGCGTSTRARRAAAAAQEKREKDMRARRRDRQWFEEDRKRRALAAQLEESGALDGPRRAVREALRCSQLPKTKSVDRQHLTQSDQG